MKALKWEQIRAVKDKKDGSGSGSTVSPRRGGGRAPGREVSAEVGELDAGQSLEASGKGSGSF